MNAIRKCRSRLTYANVVASIALFAALGGSSYAAVTVSGKNIKNNTVTTRDVRNNSLTHRDVRNGSLVAQDFRAGQLSSGARGAAGPQGSRGFRGFPGSPGLSGLEGTFSESTPNSTATKLRSVSCPAGKKIVSGNGAVFGGGGKVAVTSVSYDSALTTVTVTGEEDEDGYSNNWTLRAIAICARVAS